MELWSVQIKSAFKSRKQQFCQALTDDVASNITILQYEYE